MKTEGNNHNRQELAKWIKDGWQQRHRQANKFRHRYLAVENHRYTLLLYTLKFALMGKEGSLEKGKAAIDAKVRDAADPFAATAKFFRVPKSVLKEIGDLESAYQKMAPIEIAAILEGAKPRAHGRRASPAPPARKR
jgi:hypothetical protein